MAITLIEGSGAATGYLAAAGILARAVCGLLLFGLGNFGRPAAIDRRTGKVGPA